MFTKTIHAKHGCWILYINIFNLIKWRELVEKIGSYNLIMILNIKTN